LTVEADESLPGLAGEGLVVDNIGKSFGKRPVVKGVSVRLARGEVAGLLGPNGAGKTTCFYMITGLIPVDYGSIFLDGENITRQPMYQRARMGVGYLPQETSIFRGMTVEENVMAVVELRERSQARAKTTVTELLQELRIEHLRAAPAISLSGGERRRVEIARALASEPSFMLLDEPFAGIDPLAIADIREVITYLKGRGIGILITDHNVRETLDIIDRASIIHAGEVLFEGTPDEIVDNPDVRRVYLGERFGQD
jgi:lipopolysaccharide export system ATP-binding protein